MVVLPGVGHAKIERDLIQKRRLGQHRALEPEIVGHLKHQPVSACLQAGAVIKQPIGVAAIRIKDEVFHQHGLAAPRGVQRHPHAAGRGAVHGVQYMCAQAHGIP